VEVDFQYSEVVATAAMLREEICETLVFIITEFHAYKALVLVFLCEINRLHNHITIFTEQFCQVFSTCVKEVVGMHQYIFCFI
jgi:hypothetical protein